MARRIRRRGGQPCNHNALKHGFYSGNRVIVDGDKLPARAVLSELDHDVALTRVTLRRLFAKDPDNVDLITRTLRLHDRLLRTRQTLIDRERRARRRQRRSPSHPSLATSIAKTVNAGHPTPASPKRSATEMAALSMVQKTREHGVSPFSKVLDSASEGIGGRVEKRDFPTASTATPSLSLQAERARE